MYLFNCARCGASNDITLYARTCGHPCPLRCRRCDTAHSYVAGQGVNVIHPPVTPITRTLRASPWFDGRTRPPDVGEYQVRCRDGTVHPVYWDGAHYVLLYEGLVLSSECVVSWRGSWGDSE